MISDVRFPRGGEEDPLAGFALAQAIRADNPELPIVLESADAENAMRAVRHGLHYLDKTSPNFLRTLRVF